MTGWKRFWLLLPAVAVAMALGVVSTFAQDGEDGASFENVRLWLYPEYDDPQLLVMLQGEIVGVDIPATVRFLVPETAEMYSAGSVDEVGVYAGGPPDRAASQVPGWDEISYSLTSTTFRVEYYVDVIRGSPDRSIDYQFRALYPIADLKVYTQEPRASREYTVAGLGESSPVDYDEFDDRFAAHVFTYQNLAAADVLDFQIAYTRSTSEPSLVPPVEPSAVDEDGGSTGVVVAVTAAALIVLGGGAFWVYRARGAGRPRPATPARLEQRPRAEQRLRAAKRQPETVPSARRKARAARFCTNCGERLSVSDRFCSGCGAKIE